MSFKLPHSWTEIDAAQRAIVRPAGAGVARDVSPLALEDVAAAGDGDAHGALQHLPHLPPQGGLPLVRLIQLAFQGVERFL